MKRIFTHLGPLYIREVYSHWDGPRLFSCQSPAGHMYLAYWVRDCDDGETWFFVPISHSRLSLVASGGIPLRYAFTLPEDAVLWEVFIPYDDRDPVGTLRLGSALPDRELPEEDVHLDVSSPSRLGVLCEDTGEASASELREIVDIALDTGLTQEISADHLGSVLTRFQSLTTCLTAPDSLAGPFSHDVHEISEMNVLNTFEGSFGIRLGSSRSQPNLLGDASPLAPALQTFMQLLEAGDDGAVLTTLLHKIRGRTSAHYIALLKTLRQGQTSIKVAWGSPGRVVRGAELTLSKIRSTLQVLTKTDENQRTIREVPGEIVAYDAEKKTRRTFKLVSEDGVLYRGGVAEELTSVIPVPCEAVVHIEEKWEVNPTTGKEKVTYRLIHIAPQAETETVGAQR